MPGRGQVVFSACKEETVNEDFEKNITKRKQSKEGSFTVDTANEWMDGKLDKQRDNRMKETTKDQLDEQTNG